MLSKKHILFIGGDERYLEIIHLFAEYNATINLIGYHNISFQHNVSKHNDFTTINFHEIDVIILPVNGCSDKGDITLKFPEDTINLSKEILQKTNKSCTIYAGVANVFLRQLINQTNRKLITLFDRDDIAIANSIPTAEAALEIAMAETDFTIHGANILVTGFGRVGITTARLFHHVGANVTVTARKHADFARIKEMRLTPLHHDNLVKTNHIDIYINTVPFFLLNEEVIRQMKKTALIIDLASMPGGTDFKVAKAVNIHAIHALALPGKVAPITAGRVLADTLLELIMNK